MRIRVVAAFLSFTLAISLGTVPTRAFAASPAQAPAPGTASRTTLPLQDKSVRFAIIGDSGTGDRPQYDVAAEMEAYRKLTDFNFVLMLGDNIYGGDHPDDFVRKFEQPYKPLLDSGVKFYASLGNHDNPSQARYTPFNMGGKRYYSFKKGNVTFFALDSTYMSPEQLTWLEGQLKTSDTPWKVCFFHHPLYSDGKFHGPDLDLRSRLLPLFEKYGVNLVLSGHEHVYEHLKPQSGIYFFVLGNSGQLRVHNLRRSDQTESGLDTDQGFMLMEVAGDTLNYQYVSRAGETIDSGVLQRQAFSSNSVSQKQ